MNNEVKLNRELLKSGKLNAIEVGNLKENPVKILQFGEGNFLRAFADSMVDDLNSQNLFNGSIAVVQPIANGLVEMLEEQDNLYTLLLRGLENGKEVCKKKIITSISKSINPYKDFDVYFEQAKNPELRFVFSNTTESGIVFDGDDVLDMKPQVSFPAKVTALLFERFKHFEGASDKGLVFIPCELIDNNGSELKRIVLQYANLWNLGDKFISWLEKDNIFTNTLVDRIVTGYPRNEATELTKEFGYMDNLIDTGEIFHFWVIEGPSYLKEELPFDKIGLNVVWTDNATPYKMRKVRILNGGHTCSVLSAYLSGKNTVGELINDETYKTYLKKALFEEIIPTLDLPLDDLTSFSNAVFDRFANPFIEHFLLSISLNSISKFKARVLPSITEYIKRKNQLPKILTFSFASMIAFYKGTEIKGNSLIGNRNGSEYQIIDDMKVLEFFKQVWSNANNDSELGNLVNAVCSNVDFWGIDLTTLKGFSEEVTKHLVEIEKNGMENVVENIIK